MNDILERLTAVIESRKLSNGGDPEKSYVSKLFAKGERIYLFQIKWEARKSCLV